MGHHEHVVSQPLNHLLLGGDSGPGKNLAQVDAAVPVLANLAEAHHGGVGHLDVGLVLEPVGADDGRVKHAATGDGHVALGLGREDGCGDGHEVLAFGGSLEACALHGDELHVGPVLRERVEPLFGGTAQADAVGHSKLVESCGNVLVC